MSIAPPPLPPPIPARLRPTPPGMNRSQVVLLVVAVLVVVAAVSAVTLVLVNTASTPQQDEISSLLTQAKKRQDEREQAYRARLAQVPEGTLPLGWDMSAALEKLDEGDFILVNDMVAVLFYEIGNLRRSDFIDIIQRLDAKTSLSFWEERLYPRRQSVEELQNNLLEFLRNSEELNAITAATGLGLYFVPYDLSVEYYEHILVRTRLESAGTLLAARACLEARAGNVDAALQAYEDATRFAELVATDPYLEHLETRYIIEHYADMALWALVDAAELSEEQIRRIDAAMERRADTSRIKDLIVEDIGLLPARFDALELDDPVMSFFLRAVDIYDPETSRDAANELAANVDRPFPSFVKRGKELADTVPESDWFFEDILDLAISVRRSQLRSAWTRELFALAIALKTYRKEHGEYPESLEPLLENHIDAIPLDPCTERPVGYLRDGNSFSLFAPAADETESDMEQDWDTYYEPIDVDSPVLWQAQN